MIKAKIKYYWGYFLYSIGINKKAKNIFMKIDDNTDWELKLLLARINIALDDLNITLKYLDEAMSLLKEKNKKKIILEEKIGVLFKLERFNEALNILEKENQKDVDILLLIANIYLRINDWDKAEKHVRKIYKIDSENRDGLYLLAGINYKKGKHHETIKYCNKLLKYNYEKETVLELLVNTYLKLNDLKMAEKYFKKLKCKYSGQLATIFTHAKIEFKKGNIKRTYKILKFIEDQGIECNEEFYEIFNTVKKEMGK